MEEVRLFDMQWKEHNPDLFLLRRVLCIIYFVIGTGLAFIPVGIMLPAISFLLLAGSMYFYIFPYIRYTEAGKIISVYEKLKWMPVSKRQIQAVRREYLLKFCLKTGAAVFLAQQIGAWLDHTWGILNVIFPIGEIFLLFFIGIIDIYRK